MLSSLAKWNPTVALEIPLIRKAMASKGKFFWNNEMDQEYNVVRKSMLEQVQLTPLVPNKTLRLVIVGASTVGNDFVLFQWDDEINPGGGAVIVNANSTRFKRLTT